MLSLQTSYFWPRNLLICKQINLEFKVRFIINTINFIPLHFEAYQPTNAHIISYKTLLNTLKHSDMFRSCQIIFRELCSLLKFYYSIHNSIPICKRVVVAAYNVLWSSNYVCAICWVIRDSYYSAYDAHLATATATTHSHTTWYAATTPRLQIRIELWML